MLDAVFAIAVILGGIGALLGSRVAVCLLAGTFAQMALTVFGAEFNAALWMLIDTFVIVAILAPRRTWLDASVVALFAPAWGFYFVDGWRGYAGSVACCSAQFLLAFPWVRAWRRVRDSARQIDFWRDFDLVVRHGG